MKTGLAAGVSRIAATPIVSQLLDSLLDLEDFAVVFLRPEARDYRHIYANQGSRELFQGMDVDGRTLTEVWSARNAAELIAAYDGVLETGDPWFNHERPVSLRDEDGSASIRFYSFHAWRALADGGAYIATTAWDVTPRVEARQAAETAQRDLRRSAGLIRAREHESRLLQAANRVLKASLEAEDERDLGTICLQAATEVTESSLGFVSLLSEQGTLRNIAINDAAQQACAVEGGSGHRRLPSGPPLTGLYGGVLSSGETVWTNRPAEHDHSIGTPPGHPTLRSFLGVPLRHGKRVMGIVAVGNRKGGYRREDISQLESLEPAISSALLSLHAVRRLQESTTLLSAHMSNSPLGVVEFDIEFRVTRWSHEAERIFGYAAEEVLGRRIAELNWVHEDDIPAVNLESGRLYSGMVTRSKNTNRNYRKDGTVIWCEWYSSAIHDDRGRLSSILSLVLDVTARTQAEERVARQAARLASLKSVGEVAASVLEVPKLGQRLAEASWEASGADRVMVVIPNEIDLLVACGSRGYPAGFAGATSPLSADSVTATVYRRGRPVYLEDAPMEDPSGLSAAGIRTMDIASLASIPLRIEDKAIGAVTFAWKAQHVFDPEETSFLESVAAEIAVGMQHALLYEAERARRKRIQALHGVMEVAVASLDAADAAQRILGYLRDHHTFDLADVWLARGDSLALLACIDHPDPNPFSSVSLKVPCELTRAFKRGRPVVASDTTKDSDVRFGAYAIVPLRSRGRTVGVFRLGWHRPRPVTAADVAFYESVGGELGVLLENAELLNERTQQAAYAEALNGINEAVHSTLDFEEIMRRVVVDSAEAANFDGSGVCLRENGAWRFAYTHGLPAGLASTRLSEGEARFVASVLDSRQVLLIHNAKTDERVDRGLVERLDITVLLGLPLMVRGEGAGLLFAWMAGETAVIDDRQVDFMKKVASTASLAIENARLYDAERTIADRLQAALLLMPESVRGIEFSHAYRSATEAARVGGDFYDLFELDGERVGVVIGDVAGKGIDAAVLTSLVKNTIRAHASQPGRTPAQIMELANDIVHRSTPVEVFVTVFFGVLDTLDGSFVYANAGHTVGAVVRSGEPVGELRVTGPLLGAFATARYGQEAVRLGFGDSLFLYTDGLTEARRGREMFGETRLRQVLTTAEAGSSDALLVEVIGEVTAFTGGLLNDDLAMLVVKLVEHAAAGPRQERLDV
ncbi:MAG: GAF domain-containing protein [Coriobacteriia bacterium]